MPRDITTLKLAALDLKARDQKRLQVRDSENAETIARYAELYREKGADALPPISVIRDPSVASLYWLTDGWHRVRAAHKAGLDALPAKVSEGDIRTATLAALGANGEHGLPLTLDERKAAATGLLEDAEWRQWSDKRIAAHVHVSPQLVAKLRRSVPGAQVAERKSADGKTRKTVNSRAQAKAQADSQPAVAITVGRASHDTVLSRHLAIRDRTEFKGMHPVKVLILIALDLAGEAVDRTTLAALVCPALDVHPGQLRKAGLIHGDNSGYTLSDEGRALVSDPEPKPEPETIVVEGSRIETVVDCTATTGNLKPAWKTEPATASLSLDERRSRRAREIAVEQLRKGKPRWAGSPMERELLAMQVGMNNDPYLIWGEEDLRDAPESFTRELLAGCLDAYANQFPPKLPNLAELCRLWGLDADSIRILAERSIPE
jgi:hypothetical protein